MDDHAENRGNGDPTDPTPLLLKILFTLLSGYTLVAGAINIAVTWVRNRLGNGRP